MEIETNRSPISDEQIEAAAAWAVRQVFELGPPEMVTKAEPLIVACTQRLATELKRERDSWKGWGTHLRSVCWGFHVIVGPKDSEGFLYEDDYKPIWTWPE